MLVFFFTQNEKKIRKKKRCFIIIEKKKGLYSDALLYSLATCRLHFLGSI